MLLQSNQNQETQPIRQGNLRDLRDPREKERLLKQYAGIFKNDIVGFAERVTRKAKKQTNHSR